MIRINSEQDACHSETAEQGTHSVRQARHGRKGLTAAILTVALILLAAFSIRFVQSESICLGPDDVYTTVYFPGTYLLFHGAAGGGPQFRFIGAGSGSLPEISTLTFHCKKYAVFIHLKNVTIYDNGTKVSGYENENQMETISSCIADYDHDENDDLFLLWKKQGQTYGERLIILSYNGQKTEKIDDESFQKVNPWKVQVCDVDGDGKPEVSLGVYTVAKYHPVYAKRPFLYEFSNHRLYPKWLGSRLSQPFDDYVFSDLDGDRMDELIALETTQDDKKELDAYKWTGFGFESIGVSQGYDTIRDLRAAHGSVKAVCGTGSASAPETFVYRNEKLIAGG